MQAALRSSLAVLLAAGSFIGASSVQAAGPSPNMRMQQAGVCDGIQQDRQACLREMGAAREAARNGNLTNAAPTTYTQNALARCSLQPPGSRDECEARVMGTGRTTIEGSVMGGGLIRETVTPISAPVVLVPVRPVLVPVR